MALEVVTMLVVPVLYCMIKEFGLKKGRWEVEKVRS
jgi:hypothetical protein